MTSAPLDALIAAPVARTLRVQYPGAMYHVMNRGDRREAIFTDDADRRLFLETLGDACEKTDWQIHAWCLMNNHFHLVAETPRANLVDGMKWLLGVYTGRFNRRHKEFGHLFPREKLTDTFIAPVARKVLAIIRKAFLFFVLIHHF